MSTPTAGRSTTFILRRACAEEIAGAGRLFGVAVTTDQFFQSKEKKMTRRFRIPGLLAVASFLMVASAALAHDPAKKSGMDDMECGTHHAAAMKASEDVSMHLAEAKKAGTMAEMRTHVEAAEKAMADMRSHVSSCMEGMHKMHHGEKMGAMGATSMDSTAKLVDPVCGMEIDKATAKTASYKGQTYYFCSEDDKAKFLKNPEQYASKKP
jgi:YHS domain-containing protein